MTSEYRTLGEEVADEGTRASLGLLPATSKEGRRIMDGFLYGQLSNAAKTGIWWVFLPPLIGAILKGDEGYTSYSRLGFNTAMIFLSPFAGFLAQVHPARHILNVTTVARSSIYVIFIPLLWVLMDPDVITGGTFPFFAHWDWFNPAAFLGWTFIFLMFLDGVCVASSNIVDIDCGGIDLIAKQHGVAVDDNLRNKFNSLHETVFNIAMIVVSPLFAVFAVLVATVWQLDQTSFQATLGVVLALASMFFITSGISWFCYTFMIPSKTLEEADMSTEAAEERSKSKYNITEVLNSLWNGLVLCTTKPRIRWRVVFFAIETALEDSFIMLMIPEFVKKMIVVHADGTPDDTSPHYLLLWQAVLVAIGKCGGVTSAVLMHRFWRVDSIHSYRPLFVCVFLGGLSVLIMPAGMYVYQFTHDGSDLYGKGFALGLAALSSVLFFFFSTVPKIGFATLMQNMAAEEDQSGQIFGFIAAAVTVTDSLAMIGIEQLFIHLDMHVAFWVAAGVYAIHGVVEMLIGPCLILGPSPTVPIIRETLLDEPMPESNYKLNE